MTTPAPCFDGGWITGRFRGHYLAEATGIVRKQGSEVRTIRILRGTLEDARFSPIGPGRDGEALRQAVLGEVWVAAGTGEDRHPAWQRLSLTEVSLWAWHKGADALAEAWARGLEHEDW